MSIFRTKSVEQSLRDTEDPEHQLKKSLSWVELTMFGIGVVIGAGIFTMTGRVAHSMSGPSIIISFIIAAIACGLAAMCYAEFASTVPVAGSAYTFSYASMGEIFAWIIGWDLFLELFLASSVVAQGWSAYLAVFLSQLGIDLPPQIVSGGRFDLLAFGLIMVLGMLLIGGIKESVRVNTVLVAIKLFIVMFVIVAGIGYVKASNFTPFIPDKQPVESSGGLTQPLLQWFTGSQQTAFGVSGIVAGAALVFFAYIGFDVVATTAEEAKNPKRDVPMGILGSLVVCTILYIAISLVLIGMVPYNQLDPSASLAKAFTTVGKPWMAIIISAGAVAGLTTVVLTMMIGATRVIFAMSRDGLLPEGLSHVHPKTRTPYRITLIIMLADGLLAALVPPGILDEMVNIGTLLAFVMVSIGIIVLRRKRPDLPRAFRVPWVPVIPIVSAIICLYLMLNLSIETWMRFLIWMVIGIVVYFTYSKNHSRLAHGSELTADINAEITNVMDHQYDNRRKSRRAAAQTGATASPEAAEPAPTPTESSDPPKES
ncbi:amino acid permease [Acidipropionibacterium acidipropionici]|uniref:Amino acid permease n=1 Tax=Acidipropionibacterium acidipropionici TaxID=1748 RepID=A0AAC8YDH9_9ACTN|nr:amino acid permease [Acidipropionibacterium acidipropionici]AMS04550.1 amino acid permease [Acidipropionibacterium acidipropionici]AOZ46043.1 amino acid permease [Acidipropionibacterium acidipropionici]AZP37930.1 amino acid permease [Acidipropionibacterium acidipropionici]